MRQFFVDQNIQIEKTDKVDLTGRDHHHLSKVLRGSEGTRVLLVDSAGHRFESVVESLSEQKTTLAIKKTLPAQGPQPRLRLCLAPPKGKAWDQALDTAAQLGVSEIWPVMTKRVVVRWGEDEWPSKSQRFDRILVEAAAQCNRVAPPGLLAPMKLEQALQASGDALQLLAWEESKEPSLALLSKQNLKDRWVNLWIGPEGGFDPAEAEALKNAGAVHFSLGQGLLRVPVAVASGLSILYSAWENQR